ncbi:hypothetical protein MARPO_0237s0002 [Marchantia polymorpha]|uniref:Uncharacterized protein n=1 Tax=Marchantia polymorpha TaxID=3197 RepID=A0A2R6VZJ3_MARPO|nr:hypothetical protein MARPO_0237s0002 [Marchantia polymorpha]|eukprot:PTQ27036.1 hypothetical protein MARPO_0237s0002 [Marchantia polymorpha]
MLSRKRFRLAITAPHLISARVSHHGLRQKARSVGPRKHVRPKLFGPKCAPPLSESLLPLGPDGSSCFEIVKQFPSY